MMEHLSWPWPVWFDAWWPMAGTAMLAIAAAWLAHRTLWAVLTRLTGQRQGVAAFLGRVRGPTAWVLATIVLSFVWTSAPSGLPGLTVLAHASTLALIGVLTWLGARSLAGVAAAIAALYPIDHGDNLQARRIQTQARVLARAGSGLVVVLGVALGLMTFPGVRAVGMSLLASAGVAGLVLGMAARPVLGNLIAGLQLAVTQPIRLDDVVVIEGEWGRIEEIGGSYVVVRIWDERRLVVPLQWFIEHPFQNWTRRSAQIIGSVMLWADYRLPLAPLRAELERLCRSAPEWDGRVCVLQVTEANERAIGLRALLSSADSGANWDLRCRVREGLVAYLQDAHPDCLPRVRIDAATGDESSADRTRGERSTSMPGPRSVASTSAAR